MLPRTCLKADGWRRRVFLVGKGFVVEINGLTRRWPTAGPMVVMETTYVIVNVSIPAYQVVPQKKTTWRFAEGAKWRNIAVIWQYLTQTCGIRNSPVSCLFPAFCIYGRDPAASGTVVLVRWRPNRHVSRRFHF
jgi:hypothetical protein